VATPVRQLVIKTQVLRIFLHAARGCMQKFPD
jgi:hypothetical protein